MSLPVVLDDAPHGRIWSATGNASQRSALDEADACGEPKDCDELKICAEPKDCDDKTPVVVAEAICARESFSGRKRSGTVICAENPLFPSLLLLV